MSDRGLTGVIQVQTSQPIVTWTGLKAQLATLHFWIARTTTIASAMLAYGLFHGETARVVAVFITVLHELGSLGGAAWQPPRESWTDEQKLLHFRSEVQRLETKLGMKPSG